jgi:methionyl-tRNA formyltransferase
MKPSAILMGSKPGSVAALEVLVARGWDITAVVVSKVEPHPWLANTTLREAAMARGIPVHIQSSLPLGGAVDFVLSYMYRHRVKATVRAVARHGALNFHPAPLPEFGGWASYNVAILENSPFYGCSCHHMDDGFDSGPLCAVRRFAIEARHETAVSLERRTQLEMIDLFVEICARAEAGELPSVSQDATKARYLDASSFPALKRIPDGADAETVDRYARAFWFPPYEGAYLDRDGVRIEVVPQLAKSELARQIHRDDLDHLRRAAQRARSHVAVD